MVGGVLPSARLANDALFLAILLRADEVQGQFVLATAIFRIHLIAIQSARIAIKYAKKINENQT